MIWETLCRQCQGRRLPTGRKQEQYIFGAQYCIEITAKSFFTLPQNNDSIQPGRRRWVILILHHMLFSCDTTGVSVLLCILSRVCWYAKIKQEMEIANIDSSSIMY